MLRYYVVCSAKKNPQKRGCKFSIFCLQCTCIFKLKTLLFLQLFQRYVFCVSIPMFTAILHPYHLFRILYTRKLVFTFYELSACICYLMLIFITIQYVINYLLQDKSKA